MPRQATFAPLPRIIMAATKVLFSRGNGAKVPGGSANRLGQRSLAWRVLRWDCASRVALSGPSTLQ